MHKPLTLAAAPSRWLSPRWPLAAAQAQPRPGPASRSRRWCRSAPAPARPGGAHRHRASALLGQSIVVENKPGASGNIGTYAIANAKPDGGTFGVSITGPLVNNTLLFDKLPYAPATDLAPLTLAVHQPNVLVVPAGSGIANVGQLLDALKKNPDKYNFLDRHGHRVPPGGGTAAAADRRARHACAPPSSPAALTSLLMSGDTQFGALPPIAVMPMVRTAG